MNEFIYTAKNQDGEVVKAKVEAASKSDAVAVLTGQNLFPVDIRLPEEAGLKVRFQRFIQDVRPVRSKDKVIFTRQMATLIRGGLPLAKTLQLLVDQVDNKKLKEVIEDISNSVQGGSSLADAMRQHPKIFDTIYISMVEAGEKGGNLDDTMMRLATQEEKSQEIRSKVRSALTYPTVVLVVLVAVSILMITMVIPQVANMYNELGEPLPLSTSILMAAAGFMTSYWYVLVVILIGAVLGLRTYAHTENGRAKLDRAKLSIPGVKLIVKKVYMARFTRTMSSLINSGVSVLEALEITSKAINNVHIEEAIQHVKERVKSGDPISKPITNNPMFLPLVGQMIQVGEQTGSIGDSMDKVADYFEAEVDEAMENISTLIEPATMVILGLLVAFLIAAVLLPIYGLVSSVR